MMALFTVGLVAVVAALTVRRRVSAVLVVFAVVPCLSAKAAIGWTSEQLAKKYTPDKDNWQCLVDGGKRGWGGTVMFTFGTYDNMPEWNIYTFCTVNKLWHTKLSPLGTCCTITYERPFAGKLGKADIAKLLAEKSYGLKWGAPQYDPEDKLWSWETSHKKGESYLRARCTQKSNVRKASLQNALMVRAQSKSG